MAGDPPEQPHLDPEFEDLLSFIRDSRGFDFTGYKRSSLTRRIRKRMQDVGIPDYADYRDRLETSAEEFRYLFRSEEHTSELQSQSNLVCRLLLENKKNRVYRG